MVKEWTIDKSGFPYERRSKMSTLENTISLLEVLPESDLIKIQELAKKLFRQRNAECPFPLLKEEDIMQDIELSEKQFAHGEYQNAKEFLTEIRQSYGI